MSRTKFIISISLIISIILITLISCNLTPFVVDYQIIQIATDDSHTMLLKEDGLVWATGENNRGQLGLSDIGGTNTFTQVPITDVKNIFVGYSSSMILKNDGTVWATGYNAHGQLGLGDKLDRNSFTQVTGMSDVKDIVIANNHTLVLKEDGSVWAAGNDSNGELGIEPGSGDQTTFTQIPGFNTAKAIAAGVLHSLILNEDGSVWVSGNNQRGQLGLGDNTSISTFTKITDTNITNVKSIHSQNRFSVIVKEDNSVWATGYNEFGQLGLGDTANRNTFTDVSIDEVDSIRCGYNHIMILKNDGTLWATGRNYLGELGLNHKIQQTTFTQVPDINNVQSVIAGGKQTIIQKEDGSWWLTGSNIYGQLGHSDGNNQSTFTKIEL